MRPWIAGLVRFARGLLAIVAIVSAPGFATAALAGITPAPHSVSYDRHSLVIDGRHVYVWSAEFHYWRLPSPGLWRDVLQKLHAEGYNAVSIYFDWAYHSVAPGRYDFRGIRDVDLLLDMAAREGLYVIARPGPYINAETDSGGFPGWVETQRGRARSSAPDFLRAALEWYRHIDPIIARHQLIAGGGSVILDQIENEYIGKTTDRAYMAALERQARADGIVVPFTHNSCCGDGGRWTRGVGAVDINGYDSYPQGFDCTHPDKWDIYDPAGEFADTRRALGPAKPFFLSENQGGSADPWGGPGYDACRALTDSAFERVFEQFNIAAGATLQNFYMGFGGTSWGWLPSAEAVYSSYDYGAGIDEARGLTAKYDTQKLLGNEIRTLSWLPMADMQMTPLNSNPAVRIDARVDRASGAQLFIARHADIVASTPAATRFAARIAGRSYAIAVTLNGRDSKMIVAGTTLGSARLAYTTSEVMTSQRIGGQDVAVLFGRAGEMGESVLHLAHPGGQLSVTIRAMASSAQQPSESPRLSQTFDGGRTDASLDGDVSVHVDRATGDLRLRYPHGALIGILLAGAAIADRPLLLLVGSDAAAASFWPHAEPAGDAVLVRGPQLVRSAAIVGGDTLALTGDTAAPTVLDAFVPVRVTRVRWNGESLALRLRASDAGISQYEASLAGPETVSVPALTDWKRRAGSPESAPAFDDRAWTRANRTITNNPNPPFMSPVLYADDYGFHYGDVWYRGRFVVGDRPRALTIEAGTGRGGTFAVWLNGRFVGGAQADTDGRARTTLAVPRGLLRAGAPASVAILLENMGHNEDFSHNDTHKRVRGIRAFAFVGRGGQPKIAWRIAGNRENDAVRGPLNAGGQFGERNGWYLPGFDDTAWEPVLLPSTHKGAGIAWYRTTFALHFPHDADVGVDLRIDDTPARPYRSLIYLNGWLIGRFVNDIGPQTRFVLPNGLLRTDGVNTLAIASFNLDPAGTDLGTVSLVLRRNVRTSLRVERVPSPSYGDIFGGLRRSPSRNGGSSKG